MLCVCVCVLVCGCVCSGVRVVAVVMGARPLDRLRQLLDVHAAHEGGRETGHASGQGSARPSRHAVSRTLARRRGPLHSARPSPPHLARQDDNGLSVCISCGKHSPPSVQPTRTDDIAPKSVDLICRANVNDWWIVWLSVTAMVHLRSRAVFCGRGASRATACGVEEDQTQQWPAHPRPRTPC